MCFFCDIDLTGIGQVGSKGDTGAAGSDGTAVVYSSSSTLSAVPTASWETVLTQAIAANTLGDAGDFLKFSFIAKGGTSGVANAVDALRIAIAGTAIVSTDASYPVLGTNETYHFPHITPKEMVVDIYVCHVTDSTAKVYMEMRSTIENRVDYISDSFSIDFTASNNLAVQVWNGTTASNVQIKDIKVTKYLV